MDQERAGPGPVDEPRDEPGGALPLPPHRVAARAALLGAVGGPCVAAAIAGGFAALGGGPGRSTSASFVVVASIGAGGALSLVVLAEEVARRVPPALRLVTVGLAGLLATALVSATVTWVLAFVGGGGIAAAYEALLQLARGAVHNERAPAMVAALLLVVLGLGGSRIGAWPLLRGWVPRLPVQALIAALAGLLALVVCCVAWNPPSGRELPAVLFQFTVVPAVAALALALGDRVEARVLAMIERAMRQD